MSDLADELRSQLIRNFDHIEKHREHRPPLYDTLCARLALGTKAAKLGISIDIVQPGKVSCPYHFHHAQEEAFVILEGSGVLRISGERIALVAGDTVFVPPGPDYAHQIVNTSNAPLKYLSISTRESPEVVEYPDSDKVMTQTAGKADGKIRADYHCHRRGAEVDYWDGEP